MTALSIALVVSVAMLCGTRLIGRWFDVQVERAKTTTESQSLHARRLDALTSAGAGQAADIHRLQAQVDKLEAARAHNEVWK